ncbi:PREDICTED: uncharacterized protein LOC109593190, partial [Amphimedon queenslandica]|uniref:Uncharacterized protein n=1 Tax=Amphimedon queenslandica TaxID=400682 RepID=A0AAN0K437_AMPQE
KHFCYYDDDVKESDIYLAKQPRGKSASTSSEILYELEPLHKHHIQITTIGFGESVVYDLSKQTQTSLTSGDIDDLNKEIKGKDQEIEHFKAFIKEKEISVIKEFEFVQQKLNAKDNEVNALASELASVKESSESQLQQIEKLKIRLEESHKIIDQKESEFDSMQKELMKTNERLDLLKEQHLSDESMGKMQTASKESELRDKVNRTKNREIEDLQNENKQLKAAATQKEEELI